MIESFRKLRDLLDGRERRNAVLLFAMMLIMGLIEAAGVASVMPLMAVLLEPGLVHSNQYLAAAYACFGFIDTRAFLVFLVAAVFVILGGRITFAALTQYAMARFSQMRSFTLSTRLLENYLRRPYSWFLNRHSADLGKTLLSEVDQVVTGSLIPALQMLSQVIVAVCVIVLIVAVEPVVAATLAAAISGAYSIFYFGVRRFVARLGQERLYTNRQRYQISQEVLGGVKEIKIGGLERAYVRRFEKVSIRHAHRKSTVMAIREMPRHFLEIAAVGGILTVVLVLLARAHGELSAALPLLALYTFAAFRLLPALQVIYRDAVTLRFGGPALDALHADLMESARGPELISDARPMPLRESISLENVTFTYPKAEHPTLFNITLTIPARSTVGLVGTTGAGKSTMVDILLGLLEPQAGRVLVDGKAIHYDNVRSWQKSIGYVPQHIFLADESVAANIAFGVEPDKMDMAAINRAARTAELHDFVTNDLPDGYQTIIGERGIRLSGGQRQRIGIARALYHDPELLVFDEATSALDSFTERAVMDAVRKLARHKTIILIAHRLTTVRACNMIFVMDRGRVRTFGTYDALLKADKGFRDLAGAA